MSDVTFQFHSKEIKGIGPRLAEVNFPKKGFQRLEDALYFLPGAYEDRRRITAMANLRPGEKVTGFRQVS